MKKTCLSIDCPERTGGECTATPQEDGELRDVVLEVACIFMSFAPNPYWKRAVGEQHPEQLQRAVQLIRARDEKMRMELHQLTTAIDKVYESTRSHSHPTPERKQS